MFQHCIAEKVRTIRKYRSRPLCEWGHRSWPYICWGGGAVGWGCGMGM